MNRDARAILNMRKKQNKNWNNTKPITDARQILKLKQTLKKNAFQFKKKQNRRFTGNQIPTTLIKKQFNQVFRQQGKNFRLRNFNDKFKKQNKLVEVEENGILRVTSSHQNNGIQRVNFSPEKKVFSIGSDITVTTKNKQFQSKPALKDMTEDDLEKMTLDDLPDIGNSVKRSLLSSSMRSHQNEPPSLASRLNLIGNTMVADTIKPTPITHDYKILVTNLGSTVSEDDIIELFANVGTLKNATLIQPGTALVEYYSKEDAILACESYHNRLLDGVPMHCVLQTSNSVNRTSVTSRLGGRYNSCASPERLPSTSYSYMPSFTMPQTVSATRGGSRSVEFTVKLP